MARRVFLHVGTAKSGTTYLHDLWWQHHDTLRERGLLLPGRSVDEHFVAAALVKGMEAVVSELSEDELGTWRRLLEEARDWPQDVLISHEHFSDSPADAAARALADVSGVADEVHLVLTVRDLARVLPSAWQQRVKQGARQPYTEFLSAVRDGRPDRKFWRYQDVAGILDRWTVGLPDDRVHIVTVPPSGAPRDELWRRASSVLGVRVTGLTTEPRQPNDSLATGEAELLRRVNARVPQSRRTRELLRITKGPFAHGILAGSARPERFVLPEGHETWVRERSEATVATLRARSYDVVGDLDDLLPDTPREGRTPDQATDSELLATARVVIARLVEQRPELSRDPVAVEHVLRPSASVADGELLASAEELIAAELLALAEPPPGSPPRAEAAAGRPTTVIGRAIRRLAGGR